MVYEVGDIVFFNYNDGALNKIVQMYNVKEFREVGPTHVGIISYVDGYTGRIIIHEALNKFKPVKYDAWWLNCRVADGTIVIQKPRYKLENVAEWCERHENTGYGWLTILMFLLKTLWKKDLIYSDGADSLICSEAVSICLTDCSNGKMNISKEFSLHDDLLSPMHVFKSKYTKGRKTWPKKI
ncbi:MAG: hypothetical protein ACTSU7_00075 [Candidatus Heimdallarchaeaceae archaeon]